MFEMQQLVMSNIEEDVLARSIKAQNNLLNEVLDSIESRDTNSSEIKEVLVLVEKNLRRIRSRFLQSAA